MQRGAARLGAGLLAAMVLAQAAGPLIQALPGPAPALAAWLPLGGAQAQSGHSPGAIASLPSARADMAAVHTEEGAYLIGGNYCCPATYFDDIVRFDPATNSVAVVAKLPSPRGAAAAVWDPHDRVAYVFGGIPSSHGEVVRFDPATNAVTLLSSALPPTNHAAAFWWQGTAYIFRGADLTRYTPATGAITTLPNVLPSPRMGPAGLQDGSTVYLVGGYDGSSVRSDILQYDLATGQLTTRPEQLPTGMYLAAAAWLKGHGYIFGGGTHDYQHFSTVLDFHPASNSLTTIGNLPSPRYRAAATADALDGVFVYGGTRFLGEGDWLSYDDILRQDVGPSAPQALRAIPGLDVLLSWEEPAVGNSGPLSYRVYKSASDHPVQLYASVPGTETTFTDTGGCPEGRTCAYQVSAVNVVGEGPPSNEALAVGAGACSGTFSPTVCGQVHDAGGALNAAVSQGRKAANGAGDAVVQGAGDACRLAFAEPVCRNLPGAWEPA